MDLIVNVNKDNIDNIIEDNNILCCSIRKSRIKAKQIAILEILFLFYDLNISYIKNGPLGDVKGLICFLVKKDVWDKLIERLKYIGYCDEFYNISFDEENINNTNIESINPLVWKNKKFSIYNLYKIDGEVFINQAPDKRDFKIVSYDGTTKTLKGYRGDGSNLGKRALSVEDSRCMVNLSMPFKHKNVIDPFAGAGGIVYMFKYIRSDIQITSIDIDEALKPGLEFYGSNHIVGDSSTIKLNEVFDSLVTEVPFASNATSTIINSFKNLYNYLSDKSIIVIMSSDEQNNIIKKEIQKCGYLLLFNNRLNRKGTDVGIQIYTKDKELFDNIINQIEELHEVY